MRYKLPDGQKITINQPFTYDGTSYPSNWLDSATQEQKDALGITVVQENERPNDAFYWVTENEDGSFASAPKDLDGLKKHWTEYVQMIAHNTLVQTDWMVIRKIERSVDIPADIATYRAEVVTECTRLKTAIAGATDVPALIAVVAVQNWPTTEKV